MFAILMPACIFMLNTICSTPVNKVVCSTHSSEIRGLPSWLGLHETRSDPEAVTERVTADDVSSCPMNLDLYSHMYSIHQN